MDFGEVKCANKSCKKILAHFPAENAPKFELELYCDSCKTLLEEQEELGKDNG